MSVTVNATGTGGSESGNVATFDYTGLTTAAGSNTVIVLVAVWDGAAPSNPTAIWDPATANQSMTKLVEAIPDAGVTVFGLRSPTTTGNKTIRLTWTGNCRVFPTAIAFDGCDVSNNAAAFPHTATSGSAATVNVTSATGNKVVAGGANSSSPSGITGTTIFGPSGGFVINAFANYMNGASTVTIGSTTGGNRIAAVDIAQAASVNAYSLACSAGAFTLSGKTAGLVRGRTIVSALGTYSLAIADLVTRALGLSETAGTYSLSGQAAALTRGGVSTYRLICAGGTYAWEIANTVTFGQNFVASGGSYALSGLTTVRKFTLGLSTGAYALSGKDAALSKAGAKSLAATLGTYAVSGKAANLTKVSRSTLSAAPGSYVLSGKTQTIAYTLSCGAGTYTVAIADLVTVSGGLTALSAGAGIYSVNGLAAILTRASLSAYTLACARGAYAFDIANVVTIDPGSTYRLLCDPGAYALRIADLVTIEEIPAGTTYVLTCARGSYALSGALSTRDFIFEAGITNYSYALTGALSTRDFTVELGSGSYTFAIADLVTIGAPGVTLTAGGAGYVITGRPAALTRQIAYQLPVNTGAYAIAGNSMSPVIGLPAATGTYALSGKAVTFSVAHKISAATGSYGFAGQQAVFNYKPPGPNNYILAVAPGAYAVAGKAAAPAAQRLLGANTGTYAVAGQPVNLAKANVYTLTGTTGTYAVSGPATILASGRVLIAARGSYNIAGQAMAFRRTYAMVAGTGAYLSIGAPARLSWSRFPTLADRYAAHPFLSTMGQFMGTNKEAA